MALETWTVSSIFSVDAALLAREHVLLTLDGVDTLADVSINGVEVASLENYHR